MLWGNEKGMKRTAGGTARTEAERREGLYQIRETHRDYVQDIFLNISMAFRLFFFQFRQRKQRDPQFSAWPL